MEKSMGNQKNLSRIIFITKELFLYLLFFYFFFGCEREGKLFANPEKTNQNSDGYLFFGKIK
jgi:hypothetical protein